MPDIDQKELDGLKTEAGKVSGLTTDLATANENISKANASLKEAEETNTASASKLEELGKVSDEQLNKKAADDAELTKLRAAAEKYSIDENALTTLTTEKDVVVKELAEFKSKAVESMRERLHNLGVKEEDTKDKETVILEAMEIAATSVKGGVPADNGKGTGLGSGSGGNPPPATSDVLAQNLAHIEKLRANPRGGARKVG